VPRIPSTRLNQILDQHGFDGYVGGLRERFYANDGGPWLSPGRYSWLLLIGYFKGLDAECTIAWRAAGSFALREVLECGDWPKWSWSKGKILRMSWKHDPRAAALHAFFALATADRTLPPTARVRHTR
jgi:hypothetical protein